MSARAPNSQSLAFVLSLSLLGALVHASCVFEPIVMPESARTHDAGMERSDGGHEQDAQGESDAPMDSGSPKPDAAAPGPIRHASCIASLPEELPEQPAVSVSATGRPWFDTYRDIRCDDLTDYPTCEGDSDCPGSTCVHLEGARGVCHSTWRESAPLVLSFDGGRCITKVPFEAQAKACCAHLPGFACNEWPYEAPVGPGEACSRHADCQAGLICEQAVALSESPVDGLGVCVCPEISRDEPLTEC